jgi:hypothetical protein
MKWLNEYVPDSEQWDSFRGMLVGMKDKVKDSIDIGTVNTQYSCLNVFIQSWFRKESF